jgi:hypothetical protein
MGDKKEIDIKDVGPSYENVLDYVLNKDRAYDENLRQKSFGDRFGYNGGSGCDVLDGPCSCGAWHHLSDIVKDKNIKPL